MALHQVLSGVLQQPPLFTERKSCVAEILSSVKSVKNMPFFRPNHLFLRLVFFPNPADGSRHYSSIEFAWSQQSFLCVAQLNKMHFFPFCFSGWGHLREHKVDITSIKAAVIHFYEAVNWMEVEVEVADDQLRMLALRLNEPAISGH
jgi:hypothetical protein